MFYTTRHRQQNIELQPLEQSEQSIAQTWAVQVLSRHPKLFSRLSQKNAVVQIISAKVFSFACLNFGDYFPDEFTVQNFPRGTNKNRTSNIDTLGNLIRTIYVSNPDAIDVISLLEKSKELIQIDEIKDAWQTLIEELLLLLRKNQSVDIDSSHNQYLQLVYFPSLHNDFKMRLFPGGMKHYLLSTAPEFKTLKTFNAPFKVAKNFWAKRLPRKNQAAYLYPLVINGTNQNLEVDLPRYHILINSVYLTLENATSFSTLNIKNANIGKLVLSYIQQTGIPAIVAKFKQIISADNFGTKARDDHQRLIVVNTGQNYIEVTVSEPICLQNAYGTETFDVLWQQHVKIKTNSAVTYCESFSGHTTVMYPPTTAPYFLGLLKKYKAWLSAAYVPAQFREEGKLVTEQIETRAPAEHYAFILA